MMNARRRRRKREREDDQDEVPHMLSYTDVFQSELRYLNSLILQIIAIVIAVTTTLDAAYDSVTILAHPIIPAVRLDLQNLDGLQPEHLFRFSKDNLQTLIVCLRFPLIMHTSQRDRFWSIEGLCIVLRRLVYPVRYLDMVRRFGRSRASLSRIHRCVMAWIHNRWGHLSEFDINRFTHVLPQWATAVRRVAPNCYENVVMFLDGTVRQTCVPCPHPSNRPAGVTQYELQRAQYSNHKHYHGFKAHALIAPNGICVHYFGPVDGRHHCCMNSDCTMTCAVWTLEV